MRGAALLAALPLLLATSAAHAQGARRGGWLQPEGRVDVIAARVTALHGALGVSAPLARTLRLEVAAGAGPAFAHGDTELSLRADAIVRFLLDPDAVSRWGLYAGAGLSARHEPAAGGRLLGAIVAGVEGRVRGALVPFAEVGLGGGTRIGVGLRRAMRARR